MSNRENSDSSTPPPPGECHWSSRSTDQECFLPECEPSYTREDFRQVLNLLRQPETPERSLNMTGPGRELLSFSPILPVSAATTAPLEAVAAATPRGVAYGEGRNHDLEMEASHPASIPDRAASEYGSSVLQGNNNDFQDIYYAELLSQPFSSTHQTSYEETSQDTWIERERLIQRLDCEMFEQIIHEGRERIDQTIREVLDVLSTSETSQSIHEGRESINLILDECRKIMSTSGFSVESPLLEEHIRALVVTSVLFEAVATTPLGAPGGRKRNHDLDMDTSDQSSTNDMLPPPTELSSSAVCLSGTYDADTATFAGEWAMSSGTLDDPQGVKNQFHLTMQGADTSHSTDVPQSGIYKGSFRYSNLFAAGGVEVEEVSDNARFDFTKNSEGEGSYNVSGSGVNDFGTYSISGIFKDGQLTINRIFHREQELKFRRRHTVLKSGARVLVRWRDNECYEGTVLSYDGGSREHLIKYDLDGKEIPENLARHGYYLTQDEDEDEPFVMEDEDDDDEPLVVEEAGDEDEPFVMGEEEDDDEDPKPKKRRRKETGRKKSANAGATSSAALPSSRPVKILPTAIMNDGGTDTEVKVKIKIGDQLVYDDHPTTTTKKRGSGRSFAESVAEYKAFRVSHPGLRSVPENYHDKALLTFQRNTRRRFWGSDPKKYTPLSKEQIQALEDAGFDWGRGSNRTFTQSVAEYKAFRVSHPGLRSVPENYHDKALYYWQGLTRRRYWGTKGTPLSKDEIDALDAEGFDWGRGPNRTFVQNVAALTGFKAKFGHTRVSGSFEDRILANFVRSARARYWNGSLSHEEIEKLESLEFEWEVLDAQWQNMYQKLKVFQKEHRHTRVPITYDFQLHRWTYRQRQLANLVDTHGNSRLKQWKRDLLDEIGFDYYISIRSVSEQELRIEWKWIHEFGHRVLQNLGLEFFALDKRFGRLLLRPDGVIEIDDISIILEVDEHSHDPRKYPPAQEQSRMKAIRDEARRLGYNNVIFIRVNTGNYTDVLPQQLQTVRGVFEKILSHEPEAEANDKRYDVYYVDYDDDHVHVKESEKAEAGFDSVEKHHTAKFDPRAYTVKESDLVS